MTTATLEAPATPKKAAKPFKGLCCPACGAVEDVTLALDLVEMTVECSECNETFTPQKAAEMMAAKLAKWEAVARMVEMAGE